MCPAWDPVAIKNPGMSIPQTILPIEKGIFITDFFILIHSSQQAKFGRFSCRNMWFLNARFVYMWLG